VERRGDEETVQAIRGLADLARIHYVRQPVQAGLGDAVAKSRAFVGDEPFAVLLGDTVVDAPVPVTRQLIEAYEEHRTPVLAVESVPKSKRGRYGIVEGSPLDHGNLVGVDRLVEKPAPGETDSTLAIAGRYVLTPDVFRALESTRPGRNDEIQLTDALAAMLSHTSMIAVRFTGRRYDIGSKRDYLRAIFAFASRSDEYRDLAGAFVKPDSPTQDDA
jgi:UTP--glucose-1-phosphate uridylyltransferase